MDEAFGEHLVPKKLSLRVRFSSFYVTMSPFSTVFSCILEKLPLLDRRPLVPLVEFNPETLADELAVVEGHVQSNILF